MEKEEKIDNKLKTIDYLWFFGLAQLTLHLLSHWEHYSCNYDFNVFLLIIYILHFFRRIFKYFAYALRNKALTWIGYSFIIPILVWSCMVGFNMHQYSSEMTDYETCSSFFISTVFTGYGFLLSIYQIVHVVMKPDQTHLKPEEEDLLRRTAGR